MSLIQLGRVGFVFSLPHSPAGCGSVPEVLVAIVSEVPSRRWNDKASLGFPRDKKGEAFFHPVPFR